MTPHRVVMCSFALAMACRGTGKKREEVPPATASAAPDAGVVDAGAPAVPPIDSPFQLPVVHTLAALPAKPVMFLFVGADSAMRAGTSPSFADAKPFVDVTEMLALVPPDPAAIGGSTAADLANTNVIGTGRYGTLGGTGSGYGFGIGAGGSYQAHSLSGEHGDPAKARIVLVADRHASVDVIADIADSAIDRIAVAARGEDGTLGALPVMLSVAPANAQYQVVITAVGAQIINLVDGTETQVAPGPDGMLSAATLRQSIEALFASSAGKSAQVGLHLTTHSIFSDMISGLDAAAGGTQSIGITVRGTSGGMRGRTSAVPQVRIGQPAAVGDLDKAIIRRYIKRNIQKITYCYEKQLVTSPGLDGTVTAEFVIARDGTVATSKADGMNATVAKCVAEVIFRIEFPKPTGGGIVKVSYPFAFRPTGG